MLGKKYLNWGALLLVPLLGWWIVAIVASWRPLRIAHLPLGANTGDILRFQISPSQNLLLLQNRLPEAAQWRVFQLSGQATILDRKTALWEAFALSPDETGFVALELQPDVTSTRDETFYRPLFVDFATQSERRGTMVALHDPNVVTNLMFAPDKKSVYGLFMRDAAQWNLDGQLKRRISIGEPWSDEFYPSRSNRATLDFLPATTIYAQATDQQLSLWNLESARKLFRVPALPKEKPLPTYSSDYVRFSEQSFSFRSQILAVVRAYGEPLLVVYDLKTARPLWRQTLTPDFPFCWLAPDGQTLVVAANNFLELHQARSGRLLRHFPAPRQIIAAQNSGDFLFYLDEKFDLFRQRLR